MDAWGKIDRGDGGAAGSGGERGGVSREETDRGDEGMGEIDLFKELELRHFT